MSRPVLFVIDDDAGVVHALQGDLTRQACKQAWMFGAHVVFSQPTADLTRRVTEASCTSPTAARSRPGRSSSHRASRGAVLGVPHLEALIGSGVFYGAARRETQAMKGRHVFVLGAGDSTGQTALHLAR